MKRTVLRLRPRLPREAPWLVVAGNLGAVETPCGGLTGKQAATRGDRKWEVCGKRPVGGTGSEAGAGDSGGIRWEACQRP